MVVVVLLTMRLSPSSVTVTVLVVTTLRPGPRLRFFCGSSDSAGDVADFLALGLRGVAGSRGGGGGMRSLSGLSWETFSSRLLGRHETKSVSRSSSGRYRRGAGDEIEVVT